MYMRHFYIASFAEKYTKKREVDFAAGKVRFG